MSNWAAVPIDWLIDTVEVAVINAVCFNNEREFQVKARETKITFCENDSETGTVKLKVQCIQTMYNNSNKKD